MRSLPKPIDVFQDVFNLCLEGVGRADLKLRYSQISGLLNGGAIDYDNLAAHGELWQIPANDQDNDEVVVGQVTKAELKKLYSNYLAARDKPANVIYDRLMALAPGEMCPYCGMGRV